MRNVQQDDLAEVRSEAELRARMLELYADLYDVKVRCKTDLLQSLDALNLPHTWESVQQIVEHRKDVLKQVRDTCKTVKKMLSKSATGTNLGVKASYDAMSFLKRIQSTGELSGADEETKMLQKLAQNKSLKRTMTHASSSLELARPETRLPVEARPVLRTLSTGSVELASIDEEARWASKQSEAAGVEAGRTKSWPPASHRDVGDDRKASLLSGTSSAPLCGLSLPLSHKARPLEQSTPAL